MLSHNACVLDARRLEATLISLSLEISAVCGHARPLALIGIRTRGLPLAHRLAAKLREHLGREILVGSMDINLYRDDLMINGGAPVLRSTDIPFDLSGSTVILVDDVLFSGRTVRAAMDALLDHGRPKKVWLAVLVDRGGRELPIHADFVGLPIHATSSGRVSVKLAEIDNVDGVYLERDNLTTVN